MRARLGWCATRHAYVRELCDSHEALREHCVDEGTRLEAARARVAETEQRYARLAVDVINLKAEVARLRAVLAAARACLTNPWQGLLDSADPGNTLRPLHDAIAAYDASKEGE